MDQIGLVHLFPPRQHNVFEYTTVTVPASAVHIVFCSKLNIFSLGFVRSRAYLLAYRITLKLNAQLCSFDIQRRPRIDGFDYWFRRFNGEFLKQVELVVDSVNRMDILSEYLTVHFSEIILAGIIRFILWRLVS